MSGFDRTSLSFALSFVLVIAFVVLPRPVSAKQNAALDEELQRQLQQQEDRINELEAAQQDQQAVIPDNNLTSDLETQVSELAARLSAIEASTGQLRRDLNASFLESPSSQSLRSTTGRLHLDYWAFPQDTEGIRILENGAAATPVLDTFELRRIRIGIRGQVPPKNVTYQLDLEFAGIDQIGVRDAWIGIDNHPIFDTIRFGNQKRPYGLDQLNSSNFMVFLERPLIIEAINDPNRRYGIQVFGATPDLAWNWRYGAFNLVPIEEAGTISSNTYQSEFAGRLANTAWYDESSDGRGYLHLGVSTSFGFPAEDPNTTTARFRTRPEARPMTQWLDTGNIGGAQAWQIVGAESVLNIGSLQAGMEMVNLWLNRDTASEPDLYLNGGYVYLSYFLTGEYIPWNRKMGILGRVEPRRNFIRDVSAECPGWGAWQLAVRGSYADLNDANIFGGYGRSLTVGLNWYWNSHTRWQLNYIIGNIHDRQQVAGDPTSGLVSGDYQIIGTRMMIDY